MRILSTMKFMIYKKQLIISIIAVLALTLASCSKTKKGSGDGSEEGTGISDQDIALQNSRFGEGTIPRAGEDGPFKDVHFEFNSAQVESSDLPLLEQYAKTIRDDSTVRVEIEGHSDKRGTTEYNMALGQRRARSVATTLSKFGAPASQLSTVSYGEEVPLDPSDSEDAYSRNRRVHFSVYKK